MVDAVWSVRSVASCATGLAESGALKETGSGDSDSVWAGNRSISAMAAANSAASVAEISGVAGVNDAGVRPSPASWPESADRNMKDQRADSIPVTLVACSG